MNNIYKTSICTLILFITCVSFAQNKNYELETTYMNCMYGVFEDDGAKLKVLIEKAEQTLIQKKFLKDASGESYVALYKNIKKAIDGKVPSFGISDHVIKGMSTNKKIKEYMSCMQGLMQSPSFENSKLSKFIQLSSSGNNNPEITVLADKLLTIFEAEDFNHIFYKYLTFSLIDKFNASSKTSAGSSKGEK